MSEKKQAGNWLKKKLDDSPIITLLGLIALVLSLIWTIIRLVDYYFIDKEQIEVNGIELIADYYPLSETINKKNPILFVYGIEKNKNPLFVSFPLYIVPKNNSKSENNIIVYFKYQSPIKYVPTENFYFNEIISQKLKRNVNNRNGNQEVSYFLETLNPKLQLGIPEGIILPSKIDQKLMRFQFGVSARDSELQNFEGVVNYHYSTILKELVKLELEDLKTSINPELRQNLDIYFVIPKEYKERYFSIGKVHSNIANKENQKLILGKYLYDRREIWIYDEEGKLNEKIK